MSRSSMIVRVARWFWAACCPAVSTWNTVELHQTILSACKQRDNATVGAVARQQLHELHVHTTMACQVQCTVFFVSKVATMHTLSLHRPDPGSTGSLTCTPAIPAITLWGCVLKCRTSSNYGTANVPVQQYLSSRSQSLTAQQGVHQTT